MSAAGRHERAFTVVEMLMVVAIMALLTVGVAQVFRVTGQTVKSGRRLSTLNAQAAMIEKRLRQDFASMTREGFLVIRHRTAGGTAPFFTNDLISLGVGDPSPRRRRVDEIVFFVTGDFTSKRDPLYPSRQAKSTQARIYIGQGLRKDPNSANFYNPVTLDDSNFGPDTPNFGRPGPNQYASGWTLLRYETLLCQPKTMVDVKLPNNLVDPAPVYTNGDPTNAVTEDLDNDIQIAIQPAASGIFRVLLPWEPDASNIRFTNNYIARDDTTNGLPQRPMFTSGVIDIATTDLAEIRTILLDAQQVLNGRNYGFSIRDDELNMRNGDPTPDKVKGSYFEVDSAPSAADSVTRRMQAWMREAFPATSDSGQRMRYEPQPPDFLGARGSATGQVYQKEYQRTDQAMLSANNFVPGCSEFIVEWSFGKAYPQNDAQGRGGQLIWHGLARPGGFTPSGQPAYAALPYGDAANNGDDWYYMPYRRLDGSTGYWPPKELAGLPVNANLVRLYFPNGAGQVPEYSYFGYIDPTYRMRSAWTDRNFNGRFDPGFNECFVDANHNGIQDADEPTCGNGDMWYDAPAPADSNNTERPSAVEPDTIPWCWPKLIRITMNLVDPADPLREQTFQFIFEVPRAPGDAQ